MSEVKFTHETLQDFISNAISEDKIINPPLISYREFLELQIAELRIELAEKDAEIENLKEQIKSMNEFIGQIHADHSKDIKFQNDLNNKLKSELAEKDAVLEKLSKLKPRWDDHGAFYKTSDVDAITKQYSEVLQKYEGEG